MLPGSPPWPVARIPFSEGNRAGNGNSMEHSGFVPGQGGPAPDALRGQTPAGGRHSPSQGQGTSQKLPGEDFAPYHRHVHIEEDAALHHVRARSAMTDSPAKAPGQCCRGFGIPKGNDGGSFRLWRIVFAMHRLGARRYFPGGLQCRTSCEWAAGSPGLPREAADPAAAGSTWPIREPAGDSHCR